MIHFSKTAASEIYRLYRRQAQLGTRLRVKVEKGGCAGFYYAFEFDDHVNPGDRIIDCGLIQSIIDAESLTCLSGVTIDYSEDLMGGGFRFQNPNATQNCGCGNSFSLEKEDLLE